MYKHFDANNTYNWVDNLQTFIDQYNNKNTVLLNETN